MERGARYANGYLIIPSYIYVQGTTERAAAEWSKRGFTRDKINREWTRAIPAHAATAQIAKANQVMSAIYGVPCGETLRRWHVTYWSHSDALREVVIEATSQETAIAQMKADDASQISSIYEVTK